MEVLHVQKIYLQRSFVSTVERKSALNEFVPSISRSKEPQALGDSVAAATSLYLSDPNPDLIANFIALLQSLCGGGREVLAHIPVKELVEIARKGEPHSETMIRTLSCMSAACVSPQQRQSLVESGGIELIQQLVKKAGDDKKLQEECLSVLANVCIATPAAKARAASIGCIDTVHELIKSEDKGVVFSSCVAMRNMTASAVESSQKAQKAGVLSTLLKVLKRFSEQKMKYQALLALQHVACGEQETYELILQDNSIITTVIDVLTAQPNNSGVQRNCIHFITSLAETDEMARQKLGNAGGIRCIVATIRRMKTDPEVVTAGLFALRYLLFEDLNREELDKSQGMDAVTECFKYFNTQRETEHPEVIERIINNCMRVFSNATIDNGANKNSAAMNGAVQTVAEAMRIYMDSKDVQEQGCRCLRNMADRCELNRRVQVESGAIDRIVLSLLGYPDEAMIQEHGIASLVNLANGENAIQKMKDINVTDSVRRALSGFPEHVNIQSQGQALISRIDIFTEPEYEETTGDEKVAFMKSIKNSISGIKSKGGTNNGKKSNSRVEMANQMEREREAVGPEDAESKADNRTAPKVGFQ